MRLQLLLLTTCAAGCLFSAPMRTHWVATWGAPASPQMTSQAERTAAHLELENQTVREMVHTSIGGNVLRVRLSNQFGPESAEIGAVHVSTCGPDAQIVSGSDHAVTFGGKPAFTIPPNAPFLSDPIELNVPAASNLCISLFLPKKTSAAGIHYDARQKTFIASGDVTAAP